MQISKRDSRIQMKRFVVRMLNEAKRLAVNVDARDCEKNLIISRNEVVARVPEGAVIVQNTQYVEGRLARKASERVRWAFAN